MTPDAQMSISFPFTIIIAMNLNLVIILHSYTRSFPNIFSFKEELTWFRVFYFYIYIRVSFQGP
jgi:hypothetical protein